MKKSCKESRKYFVFHRTTKRELFILCAFIFLGPFHITNADNGFLEKAEGYEAVEPSLIEDLLSSLEVSTKDNYDQIVSWQGLIDFASIRTYYGSAVSSILKKNKISIKVAPQKCKELTEGTINFKVDLKRDMRWIHLKRPEGSIFTDPETMKTLGSSGIAFDNNVIKTPDFIMMATPLQIAQDGLISKRIATKAGKGSSDYLDMSGFSKYPTNCFFAIGPTWNWLSSLKVLLFDKPTTPKLFKDTVVIETRSTDKKTEYYIRFGVLDNTNSNIESYYEMVLPSDTGFNPTLIRILEAPTKKITREFNISYLKLNNIFLPSNYRQEDYDNEGMLTLYKQYTLKEQKINETIEEDIFGIVGLGLQNGEILRDKILNKESVYQNGKLVDKVE